MKRFCVIASILLIGSTLSGCSTFPNPFLGESIHGITDDQDTNTLGFAEGHGTAHGHSGHGVK